MVRYKVDVSEATEKTALGHLSSSCCTDFTHDMMEAANALHLTKKIPARAPALTINTNMTIVIRLKWLGSETGHPLLR